jgi:Anticodon binding domain
LVYFQVWTPDQPDNLGQLYKSADLLGIPFVVIVDPSSVETGIVRIRDRETCWFEQIHASHVTQKMVRVFQDRFVEDELTRLKRLSANETQAGVNVLKPSLFVIMKFECLSRKYLGEGSEQLTSSL